MRKVRFSAATSLDGFIAGPNGEHDWILMDPDMDFAAMMGRFDTVLIGRKTYDATRGHSGGGMPGVQSFVISRTLQQKDVKGATIARDPAELVTSLKKQPGKDIWLFGGGELFGSLLGSGLVDAVEVAVIPVLLGGGRPLLPHPAKQAKLKLAEHHVYPKTGTVLLEYVPV